MSSHLRQSRLPIGAGEQFKQSIAAQAARAGHGAGRPRTPGTRPVIGAALARTSDLEASIAVASAPVPLDAPTDTAPSTSREALQPQAQVRSQAQADAVLPFKPRTIATLPGARTAVMPRWLGAAGLLVLLLAAGLWVRGALVLAF